MLLIGNIILLIVLVGLSGVFSGIEIAYFSLSDLRVSYLVKKKKIFAETVQKLKNEPNKLLITILIGNNVVNIGAASLATAVTFDLVKNNAVGIATGVMTLIILIFGEILPKAFARKHAEIICLLSSKPILLLTKLLFPVIYILRLLTNLVMHFFGTVDKPIITEEEIKNIVTVGKLAGEIKETEMKMIHKIFKFDDLTVSQIMTPKADMNCIDGNSLLVDHVNFFLRSSHSRIPVYEKHKDHIIGIVYFKDVVKYIYRKKLNIKIKDIATSAYFVPSTKKIDTMLRQFQGRKKHLAIVVDEHGSVIGLVTIEDVLEEIVGEIIDETDKIEPNILKKGRKTYLIRGRTDIAEINDRLKIQLKETEDFDTLGGFILHKFGKIPEEMEEFKLNQVILKIIKINNNRIDQVQVTLR